MQRMQRSHDSAAIIWGRLINFVEDYMAYSMAYTLTGQNAYSTSRGSTIQQVWSLQAPVVAQVEMCNRGRRAEQSRKSISQLGKDTPLTWLGGGPMYR